MIVHDVAGSSARAVYVKLPDAVVTPIIGNPVTVPPHVPPTRLIVTGFPAFGSVDDTATVELVEFSVTPTELCILGVLGG